MYREGIIRRSGWDPTSSRSAARGRRSAASAPCRHRRRPLPQATPATAHSPPRASATSSSQRPAGHLERLQEGRRHGERPDASIAQGPVGRTGTPGWMIEQRDSDRPEPKSRLEHGGTSHSWPSRRVDNQNSLHGHGPVRRTGPCLQHQWLLLHRRVPAFRRCPTRTFHPTQGQQATIPQYR